MDVGSSHRIPPPHYGLDQSPEPLAGVRLGSGPVVRSSCGRCPGHARLAPCAATSGGLLVWRAGRRHDPRKRVHPAAGLARPRRFADRQKGRRIHPPPTASRRRLGHVSRRAARYQRQRQSLFRAQARRATTRTATTCGGLATRSASRAGPMQSTASRGSTWPCSGRFPTTSAPPCRLSWSCCPIGRRSTFTACRPGRGRLSCRSRSCGPIAQPQACSRAGHSRAVPAGRARVAQLRCPGLPDETGLVRWERFFRRADSLREVAGKAPLASAPQPSTGCRRGVDDDAVRPQRRAGGDLPADHLEHHRTQVPRLRRRQRRVAVQLRPVAGPDDRRARDGPLAAVPFARLGHDDRPARPGRLRPCPRQRNR